MSIVVRVAGRSGLLVSEPKTELMCMLARGMKAYSFTANATGMLLKYPDTSADLKGNMYEGRRGRRG